MVTVNFTSEQGHEEVKLPTSQTARPMPKKGEKDPIFLTLTVNKNTNEHTVTGYILGEGSITGKPPAMKQAEASAWIRKQHQDLERYGEVTSAVIIRAAKDCDYGQVYQLLRSCADAGFRNLKVRAIVHN
jgi:biopolymer transport protein ExbD